MKFILPMTIGGIIGYFTNWLAIKMLFRPYEEKFFLGYKIPFTPGLIPKEQKRIAQNIGITVEEYLLSPQAIIKSFKSKDLENYIKNHIEDSLIKCEESQVSISELFGKDTKNYKVWLDDSIENLLTILIKKINSNKLAKSISEFISDDILIDNLEEVIDEYLYKYLNSEKSNQDFKKLINRLVYRMENDNRSIRDIFPDGLESDIGKLLDENQNIISYRIREFLTSPEIKDRLKTAINNMVEANVSSLITTFVSIDKISEKIYHALEKYIKSQEATKNLNILLKLLASKILDSNISQLSKEVFSTIDKKNFIEGMYVSLNKNINSKKLTDLIINKYKSLDKSNLSLALANLISSIIEDPYFQKKIMAYVNKLVNGLINIKISDILYIIKLDADKLYDVLITFFNNDLDNKITNLIGKLGIANIVEDTINEFEFDFVEKLILDIAAKELKAITNLGGILGALIGLLTPIFQIL